MRVRNMKVALSGIVFATLLVAGALPIFSQVERLDATSFGTSTQTGQSFNVKVIINQYSTPEDRQTLIDAFQKGQNAGLVKALSKMKPVGRISLPAR